LFTVEDKFSDSLVKGKLLQNIFEVNCGEVLEGGQVCSDVPLSVGWCLLGRCERGKVMKN